MGEKRQLVTILQRGLRLNNTRSTWSVKGPEQWPDELLTVGRKRKKDGVNFGGIITKFKGELI